MGEAKKQNQKQLKHWLKCAMKMVLTMGNMTKFKLPSNTHISKYAATSNVFCSPS